jgi:hypothetical protein
MTAPTLTDFILARIAEDEAEAGHAYLVWDFFSGDGESLKARVLAECEAKRRIVERHSQTVECGNVGCQRRGLSGMHCLTCDDEWPCPDLRDLAVVYADHPDYRDEWKP